MHISLQLSFVGLFSYVYICRFWHIWRNSGAAHMSKETQQRNQLSLYPDKRDFKKRPIEPPL